MMADAHSSRGDPARSIALLWRDPAAVPRRGPARAWDLDAVVDAAIGLADGGGLAAVTIRAVARRRRGADERSTPTCRARPSCST